MTELSEGDRHTPVVTPFDQPFVYALAIIYCALKLVLLSWYAVFSVYIMDEYAQAGHSIHIPAGFYSAVDPLKTVLYAYFYELARLASSTSTGLMHVARLQTLVLVLAIVVLLWRSWRSVCFTRGETVFAICVLLAFSNFMEHSFRVRSDSVALFLEVAAFAIACEGDLTSYRRALSIGMLLGLAFLCTQKAAHAAVAAGFGIAAAILFSSGFRKFAAVGAVCLGGFALDLLGYALALGGWRFHRVLVKVFTNPLVLAMHGQEYYPDLRRYVWQTLTRNAFAYALCAAGLAFAVATWRTSGAQRRFAITFTIVITILVFTHNQPWPYVFTVANAFLAVWAVEPFRVLSRMSSRHSILPILVALLLLSSSFIRNLRYTELDNAIENAVSDQAESLLARGDRYQDGVGMVTTRQLASDAWWDAINISWFRAEVARGDLSRLNEITARQPKLWILNYRVRALWPILQTVIDHSYVRVYPNILLAGSELGSTDRWFVNRWRGMYAVYGPRGVVNDSLITIDGQTHRTPLLLDLRTYRVTITAPASEPRFLLPFSLPLQAAGPVQRRPFDLFAGVYD